MTNSFFEIFGFDVKSNRLQKLYTDKFALFSEVWKLLVDNCFTNHKLGVFITVVEQLFPSKARWTFTLFMTLEPDKFG